MQTLETLIFAILILAAMYFHLFQAMQAAKRRSIISQGKRLESAWRMRLMSERVILTVPKAEPSVYQPVPTLVPSYAQQRPAREGKYTSVEDFADEISSNPIEAIGNAHGLFMASSETPETFRTRVIERLDVDIQIEKGRRVI